MPALNNRKNNVLRRIYFDNENPAGFSSKKKLLDAAQLINPRITPADVTAFFETNLIPSKFGPSTAVKFPRPAIATSYVDRMWEMDLGDLSRFARENSQFKWLYLICDAFSKSIVALLPLKNKSAKDVSAAFDGVLNNTKAPEIVRSDQGLEFSNKLMKKIYAEHGIKHRRTSDVIQKAAIAEGLLRVVKTRLFKVMAAKKEFRWIDELDAVKKAVNNSVNTRLGITPNQAKLRKNRSYVFYKTVIAPTKGRYFPFKFHQGQIVRVLLAEPFQKGYEGVWSSVLYTVDEQRKINGIPAYYLRELLTKEKVTGAWFTSELKLVRINKRRLPKIDRIISMRRDPLGVLEANVVFTNDKNHSTWIKYDSLLPY